MRQREYRMCILICTREAREMSKMEWQDRSTHREQWENEERAWYEMYSSWISDSLCERCSETQSAHPSTPLPCTSHPLSGLSACKPTKSLYYHKLTQHDKLRWWKCRCGLLLNPLKQHYTDVRPSFPPPNWCVIHHHHTPTCGHFYCFESAVEGDGESCLKSTSDFINITSVWYAHSSSTCQRLVLCSSTNPGSIMSSPLLFDERLLSVVCRVLEL